MNLGRRHRYHYFILIASLLLLSGCSTSSDSKGGDSEGFSAIQKTAVQQAWNLFSLSNQLAACESPEKSWIMIEINLKYALEVSVTPVNEAQYKKATKAVLKENC